MSASQPPEDMDSSNTNLNSSSTQTTELQSDGPSLSSLPPREIKSRLSLPYPSPHLSSAAVSAPAVAPSSEPPSAQNSSNPVTASSPLPDDIYTGGNQRGVSGTDPTGRDAAESSTGEDLKQSLQSPGVLRTAEETVHFVTSLQSRRALNPFQVETFNNQRGLISPLETNARPTGFVSSEQLQEILQELSVDAVLETALRSPGQTSRRPSQLTSALSPLSLRTPCSPHPPPVLFRYPSISPYAMRKRRPPFHSSRRGLACFYTGSEAAGCGRIRENCEHQNPGRHPDGVTADGALLQAHNTDLELEEEEEDAEGNEVIRKCRRCVSRSHRCSVLPCAERHTAPADVEAGGDNKQHRRHIRDSCGSWDSDSSSSTDYCYYHRPYCDSCRQRGSLLSSDSSSDSSDSEYEGYTSLYRPSHPVVFKEDIKPTFVWAQVHCTLHAHPCPPLVFISQEILYKVSFEDKAWSSLCIDNGRSYDCSLNANIFCILYEKTVGILEYWIMRRSSFFFLLMRQSDFFVAQSTMLFTFWYYLWHYLYIFAVKWKLLRSKNV